MIKVKQCSYKTEKDLEFWYRDKIGQEFDVVWSNEYYYWVKYNDGKCMNVINVKDVE